MNSTLGSSMNNVNTQSYSSLDGFSKINTLKKLYGSNNASFVKTPDSRNTPTASRKSVRVDFSLDSYKKGNSIIIFNILVSPVKKTTIKSSISDYLVTPIMNNTNHRGKTAFAKINNWESLNTMTSLNSLNYSTKEKTNGFNAYTRLNDLLEGKKELKKKKPDIDIFDLSRIKRAASNLRVARYPSSEDIRNTSLNSQSYLNKSREVSIINQKKSGFGNIKLRKEIETFSKSLNQSNTSYINRPTSELNQNNYLDFTAIKARKSVGGVGGLTSSMNRNYTSSINFTTTTATTTNTLANTNYTPSNSQFINSYAFKGKNDKGDRLREKEREEKRDRSFINLNPFMSSSQSKNNTSKGVTLKDFNEEGVRERRSTIFTIQTRLTEAQQKENDSVDNFGKDLEGPKQESYISKFSPKKKNGSGRFSIFDYTLQK